MIALAHLSDPHLAPLPKPRVTELASKRLFGFLNWRYQRVNIHRTAVLDQIVQDVKGQSPAHIAVTGDLVNIALPDEFVNARRWLEGLGTAHDVSLVPGNHDAYMRSAGQQIRLWGDYMRGDGETRAVDATIGFPFVRRRGPLVLVGTSTAVPTSPASATGLLGGDQLQRLAKVLEQFGAADLFRILLIHHPPAGVRAAHKRLIDAEPLADVLRDRGVELVLHGHDHIASLNWLDGPRGRIPVVGVPSASASPLGHHVPAAYNLYRIEAGGDGAWRCEIISRGFQANGRTVVELGRQMVSIEAPQPARRSAAT